MTVTDYAKKTSDDGIHTVLVFEVVGDHPIFETLKAARQPVAIEMETPEYTGLAEILHWSQTRFLPNGGLKGKLTVQYPINQPPPTDL